MKTLQNNFTSQTIYKYGKHNLQSIKLPNIRQPYRALYIGLDGVSDAQIDTLYAALKAAYKADNTKQEIINIMATAPHRLQRMFEAALTENGYNDVSYLVDPLQDALYYMLDVAKKDFDKENATPREINTYKRLSVVDKALHFGKCFTVLSGSVTDDQGFELTEEHINEYTRN